MTSFCPFSNQETPWSLWSRGRCAVLTAVVCRLEVQRLGESDAQGTQTGHPHHAHEQTRPGMEEHGHRDHLLGGKMQQSGENQQSDDFITADLSWWTGQEGEQIEQQITNKGLPKG